MPNDDFPLPDTWINHTHLISNIRKFYEDLNTWHSRGGGERDQIVQPKETAGTKNSIVISVSPIGIKIIYEAMPSESEPSDEHGRITRIDEKIIFSSPKTKKREISGAFLLSNKYGGVVLNERHPLLKDVRRTPTKDMRQLMMRYYLEIFSEQAMAATRKEGLVSLPVELMVGVSGTKPKFSLAAIEDIVDPKGNSYTWARFEDLILPALEKCYPDISHVDYDKLYIIDDSLLIDCGDSSVLGGIREGALSDIVIKLHGALYDKMDSISVYEHEDAAIQLVDEVFPDSASVYVCAISEGIVEKMFESYVLRSKTRAQARVEPGSIILEDRDLRISLLGELAEQEFARKKEEYDKQREAIETKR